MTLHATTILTVRRADSVAIGCDGQVSIVPNESSGFILKGDANKIRRLHDGSVVCGFSGGTADAFALFERFEKKLKSYSKNMLRAATELAKDWRTERALRQLRAQMIAVNTEASLLIDGTGNVVETNDGVLGVGSGGNYAVAAARALLAHTDMPAGEIVRKSLEIAADIDLYTNHHITVEELSCPN